jgi:hypothetical protein
LGDVIASYDYHFTGYYLVAIRGQPAFSVVGMENNSHWKYSTEYTQQRKSTEKMYEITSTFFLPSIFQIIKIKHVTVYRRKMPHFDVLVRDHRTQTSMFNIGVDIGNDHRWVGNIEQKTSIF